MKTNKKTLDLRPMIMVNLHLKKDYRLIRDLLPPNIEQVSRETVINSLRVDTIINMNVMKDKAKRVDKENINNKS